MRLEDKIMGFAEFEEKEFEKPLYNQLENGKCDVWTPGQCFERYIGFDYSGNISNYEFWKKFSGFIPRGVVLDDYNMGYIWRKMKKKRMLPDFSMNLFIQAKRPYIHSGTFSGAIYDTRHYSFEINKRQQKILERLDYKLHHRALLVYAAPVFGTYEELYKYTHEEKMIENTSFIKIHTLSGHSHWYYCNAENGIAHSEPEEKHTFSIYELIERFKQEYTKSENTNYNRNINELAKAVLFVLNEFKEDIQVQYCFSQLLNINMQRIYEYLQYEIYEYHQYYQYEIYGIDYRTVTSFLLVALFCDVFNLDWFVL